MGDLCSPKNPFFSHADVRFFIAFEGCSPVGRVVSIANRRHIEFHHEQAGFFGFYESVDDGDIVTKKMNGNINPLP
jgi:hypothetical protein